MLYLSNLSIGLILNAYVIPSLSPETALYMKIVSEFYEVYFVLL